jgi:RNA polymerase sigma-70 factor, ECF subfamily
MAAPMSTDERALLPPQRPPEHSGVRLAGPEDEAPDSSPRPLEESWAELAAPPSSPVRDASFRAMYDAHVDFVWRNLRRLGVPTAEADDRTQEVFVIAHRRFDGFEDRGHGARAWLFQIVLRVASDARRHRRRHPEDPDGGAAEARESIEPEQTVQLSRREAMDCLDRALATIDVDRRAVLVLHEIEEMTAPEIVQVLGIPLNTVYSRLRVARLELEQALARTDAVREADRRCPGGER